MGTDSHAKTPYGQGTTKAVIEPLVPIPTTQVTLGGVSRRTVLRLLDSGELVRVRVGGRTLVDPLSLRRYIETHREGSP